MKPRGIVAGLASIAAVLLTLTSCAPAVSPTTPPSASAPAPTPTPTPTATQAVAPHVRVPLTCAGLFSDAAASAVIETGISYRFAETTIPKNISSIVLRQYGSLACLWGGPDRPDGGFAESLQVTITPDAADGFTSEIAQIDKDFKPTLSNVAGDRSEISCSAGEGLYCVSNMLVGDDWVGVSFLAGTSRAGVSVGNSRSRAALTTIAAALASVRNGSEWTAPGVSVPSFCAAGSVSASASAIDEATGARGFTAVAPEVDAHSAATWPETKPGFASCDWSASGTGFTDVDVSLLRGGSWVMPEFEADLGEDSEGFGPYPTVDIPGIGTAIINCSGDSGLCSALVASGTVLIDVEMNHLKSSVFDPALIKLVTAIAAS